MVRLTAEFLQQSQQRVNPCRDRELCLRGNRITKIQNLGVTCDQFNSIDFSDNDIRKIGGFPLLKRLHVLLFNNNPAWKISSNISKFIPNLEMLILTGCNIKDCHTLDPLCGLKYLRILALMNSPVTKLPYYRFYVIYKLPQIKVLDFKKIKMKEREEATEFFKTAAGKQILNHKSLQNGITQIQ